MVTKQDIMKVINANKEMFDKEGGYRAAPYIHYSKLSALDKNPATINKKIDETYFDYGNLVEDMYMYPTEWEKTYIVPKYPKPTGQMGWYCDAYLYALKTLIENPHDYAWEGACSLNIKATGKPISAKKEKFLERFKTDALDYVNFKIENSDKITISKEDMDRAKIAVTGLNNCTRLNELMNEGEVFFQVPLLYELNGIKVKVLFDILIVTDNGITGVDLKTMGMQLRDFGMNYSKFKYYLQEGLYTKALLTNFEGVSIDFKFLVSSSVTPQSPKLFLTNAIEHNYFMEDFMDKKGYNRKGIVSLIQDYQWHIDNDYWELPRNIGEYDEVYINI